MKVSRRFRGRQKIALLEVMEDIGFGGDLGGIHFKLGDDYHEIFGDPEDQ
jgi:hypothetical protein